MKILITGSTGFIGQNLMDYLSKGYDVYGTTRSKVSSSKYIQVDFKDGEIEQLSSKKYDVIIHCASILATSDNNTDFDLFMNNLKITKSVISFVEYTQPKLVINFSTIGVYPNINGNYDEFSTVNPSINFEALYGLSKFCSEELFLFYFKNTGTRIVNLRLGQTIGEGMREDRIYSVMKDELERRNVISVYGNGERTSAFITIEYLQDIIQKIINNKQISGTFNLAQNNMSYLDLAQQIIEKFGDSESRIEISSKGTNAKIYIDSSKIQNVLNE